MRDGPTPSALQAMRALAEKATPGPWDVDSQDSEDGHGKFKAYAVFGCDGKVLLDTLNSDAAEIHEEPYEYDIVAWDEIGRRNAAFIAAANPQAVIALIDALESAHAVLEKCRHQFQWYADLHAEKSASEKAKCNQEFADMCSDALARQP